MGDKKFSASDYRKRKAERLEKVEPQWVTAPSGAEFLLRATPALASAVASQLPSVLTERAIASWKKQGVELKEGDSSSMPKPPAAEDTTDNLRFMARVVAQGCVSPRFVDSPQSEEELGFDELEDDDLLFIVRYCTGQITSMVALKGGQAVPMDDLAKFRKRPGRVPRTRVA